MGPEKAGEAIRLHLAEVEQKNAAALDAVAARMHRTILDDGLILTAGTGHSRAMVLETFYRAGGLACVRPIVHPSLDPFEGGLASTRLERVPGLGTILVESTEPTKRDTGFIFSNSGVNPVPVEMAQALDRSGATVVAVTSVEHMSQAPIRADRKLGDIAHHILDTATPYGDAFWPTTTGTTAPLSSVTGVFLWNLLLVRLAEAAREAGTLLPIWESANVTGGDEHNKDLFARYRPRIPML